MAAVRELITRLKVIFDKKSLQRAHESFEALKKDLAASKPVSVRIRIKGAGKVSESLSGLKRQMEDISSSVANVRVKSSISNRSRSIKDYGRSSVEKDGAMKDFADGLGFRTGISAAGAAGMGIAAVGAAAAYAVKNYADFDATMSKVKAITNATDSDMQRLTDTARQLGSTTEYSASEAAEAMTYLGMAGWKAEQIIAGMPGLLDLAAASGESLATVADIVSDDLTAFGLSADKAGHMADVMAATSSNANTNVAMMGETFKYAGAVAGSLGYTLEDTALATGLMANAGIKSSQAGTSLRAIMTRLVKPTKESGTAMDMLGINVTNADGTMKPFRQTMKEIRKAFANLTDAEKAEKAAMIAGQEAMSGFLSLMNASDADFDKLAAAIDNSTGAAAKMARIMSDNLRGALKELESQLESTAFTFAKHFEPAVKKSIISIKDGIKEATKEIDNFFQLYDGPVYNENDPFMEFSGPEFNEHLRQTQPKMLLFVKILKDIKDISEIVGEGISGLVETLTGAAPKTEFLKTFLESVHERLMNIRDVLTALKEDGILSAIGKTDYGVIGIFSIAFRKAKELFLSLFDFAKEILGGLLDFTKRICTDMTNAFSTSLREVECGFAKMVSASMAELNALDAALYRLNAQAAASHAGYITNNSMNQTNTVNVLSVREAERYVQDMSTFTAWAYQ